MMQQAQPELCQSVALKQELLASTGQETDKSKLHSWRSNFNILFAYNLLQLLLTVYSRRCHCHAPDVSVEPVVSRVGVTLVN
jgi:hypothetical protein